MLRKTKNLKKGIDGFLVNNQVNHRKKKVNQIHPKQQNRSAITTISIGTAG
jgi:hypothetical protein